jgi:hypothetical protein
MDVILDTHFDGGKNLTQGHKKGDDKTLADLFQEVQAASNTNTSAIADNAADIVTLQGVTILQYQSDAGAGGAATEAMTVTGLLATDLIIAVNQVTPGANDLPLLGWSTQADDALTGIWSADPGAGAIIQVAVKRTA